MSALGTANPCRRRGPQETDSETEVNAGCLLRGARGPTPGDARRGGQGERSRCKGGPTIASAEPPGSSGTPMAKVSGSVHSSWVSHCRGHPGMPCPWVRGSAARVLPRRGIRVVHRCVHHSSQQVLAALVLTGSGLKGDPTF